MTDQTDISKRAEDIFTTLMIPLQICKPVDGLLDYRQYGIKAIESALAQARRDGWNEAIEKALKEAMNYMIPIYQRVDRIKTLKLPRGDGKGEAR